MSPKAPEKFSREQSNVSTGQPYDDALPDWRCIKCISNARMQLFFVKLVLKLNWGQKNAVKPKRKNKKQTIWVLIGENNTGPSSFILYWWFQFLPYVIVNTILSNKLMKRLQHVAKNGPKIMNWCNNVKFPRDMLRIEWVSICIWDCIASHHKVVFAHLAFGSLMSF